jgi:tripartite-type tricarboxylate transporter receptor subunit TctC
VPRNTPAEIVDKLNKEINAVLANPKMKARLADPGSSPLIADRATTHQFSRRKTILRP